MRIFASLAPVHFSTDPEKWVEPDGTRHGGFAGWSASWEPRPEYSPETAHEPNPILLAFRETYDGSAYDTHEWLFQLARHWALWQSPRIGTFPLDYRDPYGPVERERSEESGEDSVYWEIEDLMYGVSGTQAENADADDVLRRGNLAQDMIVHAVAVLSRLDTWLENNGRGI